MTETQDRVPREKYSLDCVGVTNLKTLVKTNYKGRLYRFVADVTLTINLPDDKKGAHMSRLIEAVTESVESESKKTHESLEALGAEILGDLKKRHPHTSGSIRLETDLIVYSKTPATGKDTMESHRVAARVYTYNEGLRKELSVTVLGNTVCPHSMQYAGKPHIQRAIGTLSVDTGYANPVDLEDMIGMVEESFSSPVYTLLKTQDEAEVVKKMYENPLFVEDVARKMLENAGKIPDAQIKSKAISQESIHRHDVMAQGEITT